MQALNSKSFLWMSFDTRMISRFEKNTEFIQADLSSLSCFYFVAFGSLCSFAWGYVVNAEIRRTKTSQVKISKLFLTACSECLRLTLPQYCLLYLQCSKDHNDGNSYEYSFIFLNLVTCISLSFKNTTFNDGVSHKSKNSHFEGGKWEIWENF